jgi:hypothetical protein
MLDGRKYAEHFPDEAQTSGIQETEQASVQKALIPSSLLLAALSRLEREFSDILRAQNSAQAGHPD